MWHGWFCGYEGDGSGCERDRSWTFRGLVLIFTPSLVLLYRPQIEMVLKGYIFKKGPMKVTLSKLYQVGLAAPGHANSHWKRTKGHNTVVHCCAFLSHLSSLSPLFFISLSSLPLSSLLYCLPRFLRVVNWVKWSNFQTIMLWSSQLWAALDKMPSLLSWRHLQTSSNRIPTACDFLSYWGIFSSCVYMSCICVLCWRWHDPPDFVALCDVYDGMKVEYFPFVRVYFLILSQHCLLAQAWPHIEMTTTALVIPSTPTPHVCELLSVLLCYSEPWLRQTPVGQGWLDCNVLVSC